MKTTIINNSQETLEVQYVSVDGAHKVALINPGKASLPAGATITSQHPSIRILGEHGVTTNTVEQAVAVTQHVYADEVVAPEPITGKGARK